LLRARKRRWKDITEEQELEDEEKYDAL
jgi:hypothetical protein